MQNNAEKVEDFIITELSNRFNGKVEDFVNINGEYGISIESSEKWFDEADFDKFFKDIQEQIELRIPDKFLEYHGWK
ncbi:hypothetical protein [Cohnella panacarvi]|uniref:hypothetical protein n=1 Tax=Cohnella panacarvi TaxID=400776 RepID=UPI00047D8007|nr:hypothetical protein [Cohnella panacarvi]